MQYRAFKSEDDCENNLLKELKNERFLDITGGKAEYVREQLVIKNYGGKALVRGGKFKTLEGEKFPRTVIWEFPNFQKAIECHNSKIYQDGWKLAKQTTVRNLQIVEAFNIE